MLLEQHQQTGNAFYFLFFTSFALTVSHDSGSIIKCALFSDPDRIGRSDRKNRESD